MKKIKVHSKYVFNQGFQHYFKKVAEVISRGYLEDSLVKNRTGYLVVLKGFGDISGI